MPKPRNRQISLEATPYYHIVSRCVRRAFLCGEDSHTGVNYEHRRGWIVERMKLLTSQFAIDIAAYAVMHNHYHLILFIDSETAEGWSEHEVITRWHALFAGTPVTRRYLQGDTLLKVEQGLVTELAGEWRKRLMDISWFMRCLNESVARQANEEDDCSGHFWEGRFKCQALLDEAALVACMAYVDLNPIRAAIAESPEQSDYTSIQQRIRQAVTATRQPPNLAPFVGNPREPMPRGLPFRLEDYLELVDWTGRTIRDDKRGTIPNHLSPILERLNIETHKWLLMSRHFESRFKGLVGTVDKLKAACLQLGYRRIPALSACRTLLSG